MIVIPLDRDPVERTPRPVPWWVLVTSALIPLLLTSAWLIAGGLQPASYSPMQQTVSVLAGQAGAHRWIVTSALYVVGVCYLVGAYGLSCLRRSARVALIVSGAASIGIAASPEPVVGSTTRHMVFTTIGAAVIAIWPALAARRGAAASVLLSPPVATAATIAFVSMLAWLVVETQGGSALGLAERLDSSIEITWPFVVVSTLPRTSAITGRSRPHLVSRRRRRAAHRANDRSAQTC
jgi:hypothetical protein